MRLNSKHEARNPKQIQNIKFKTLNKKSFEHLILEFKYCFEFRYSNFGFFKTFGQEARSFYFFYTLLLKYLQAD